MLSLKLAYRNLINAGLKAWLNIIVLSLCYVIIIWLQGLLAGLIKQSEVEIIKNEIGEGQYWHKNYDPYDPLTLDDSHGIIPKELQDLENNNQAVPILIRSAAIYPKGRVQSVLLKGINPNQKILEIPTAQLNTEKNILPIMFGTRMAKNNGFKINDYITIRLRNVNGTFDAVDGKIVNIMHTTDPAIDNNQLWLPLAKLQELTKLQNQATIIVTGNKAITPGSLSEWNFKSQDFLLKDLKDLYKAKFIEYLPMYLLLLFMAMLAIFDTQVLSIFRRRKEIGTLMALGLTRINVISIFTLEGMMNGILALVVGAVYGIPLMVFSARGIPIPGYADSFGLAMAEKMYPVYSLRLVLITIIIIMITVTIVSFIPTRKIAALKPTDALKGKIS